MNPRDIEWLGNTVTKALTLEEAQLAVSVFIAASSGLPLRPLGSAPLPGPISMVASRFRFVTNQDKE